MKRSILTVLLFCTVSLVSLGQPKSTSSIRTPEGSWTFYEYAPNIIKATFQPTGYKTNELVSDAVILNPTKPAHVVKYDVYALLNSIDILVCAKQDTILLGNKVKVIYNSDGIYKGFRFIMQPDEKIFGGGERALPLNRRGYRFNLYNNPWYGYGIGADNLNYSVPFITSSNNYAIFFDNPSKGYLDIGKTNSKVLDYGATSGQLNFYIITGSSYSTILQSYYKLTGAQPIPPRWALGNFLSRFGYTSEQEVKDIMQKMKQYRIPYDAVIFDLFWFGDSIKGTLGNLDWVNKTAWPNPSAMINDFKKEGTKTILITEPFVVNTSFNYKQAKKYFAVDSAGKPYILTDFYFGVGGLIDIFRNDSKDWFWSKYKQQMNKGVEGWWGDLGEPEKHPSNLYHNLSSLGFKRLFSADEVHNIYGHNWTKMLYEKYAKEYPTKRLFSLNRSGFAGSPRYGIFPWTGDVSRTWNGFKAQLPVLLGMSMSGVPYVHSDAGGFAQGEKDGELYVRWLQFAAYTPIFRPHGTELTNIDPAAPSFPSEPALMEEPFRSYAKKVVETRYKMLPYNYTLAYKQATEGKPLLSPMYYYFSNDTAIYSVEDEYMWGENVLVAPVLEKGAVTRSISLPASSWYDVTNNLLLQGNARFEYNVQDYKFPVFIREGSFIPQYRYLAMNTRDINKAAISLLYIPSSRSSSYTMYDDDGETKNALKSKQYELINFSSSGKTANGLVITIASNGGKFKGKPSQRNFLLTIPTLDRAPSSVLLNGKKMEVVSSEASGNTFNADQQVIWLGGSVHTLTVPITLKTTPQKIDLRW